MKPNASITLKTGRPARVERARPPLDPTALRVAMARADVTLDGLVAALLELGVDVSRTTLAGWRRGRGRPPTAVRRAMARALGVRVRDLEE